MTFTIDPEFKRLIPALLPNELAQLEANILRDGCLEPLTVWTTSAQSILLDGHNRYEICTKHNKPFEMTTVELASRDHALLWIGEHQLGRRNLDDDQRAVLANEVREFRSRIEVAKRATKGGQVKPLSNHADNLSDTTELRKVQKSRKKENKPRASRPPRPEKKDTRKTTAKEFNVAERKLRKAQEIAKTPGLSELVSNKTMTLIEAKKVSALPDTARTSAIQAVSTGIDVRTAIRAAKKADYYAAIAITKPKTLEGTYRVIYADPPWRYVGSNQLDLGDCGRAENKYDALDDDQLKKYKVSGERLVRDMTDKNAVLFLWVTSPLLERCFAVIETWGFEYKSSFVWDKVKHNMGHYNSVRHELLLIATKGACKPDVSKLVDSVQSIERTKHSEKPEEFRKIIESLYDHGRKLELFRRGNAPDGWDIDGNEAQHKLF